MFDLLWLIIIWMASSLLLRSLVDGVDKQPQSPITPNNAPPGTIVMITIHMEQIRGWWYGWFINEDGTETFISQGKTYDDALNNCRQRVHERNPGLEVKYKFEMKNANTTVQN